MILTTKNIVEAARNIRLFCSLRECEECPFNREHGGIEYCGICDFPKKWEIADDTGKESEPK